MRTFLQVITYSSRSVHAKTLGKDGQLLLILPNLLHCDLTGYGFIKKKEYSYDCEMVTDSIFLIMQCNQWLSDFRELTLVKVFLTLPRRRSTCRASVNTSLHSSSMRAASCSSSSVTWAVNKPNQSSVRFVWQSPDEKQSSSPVYYTWSESCIFPGCLCISSPLSETCSGCQRSCRGWTSGFPACREMSLDCLTVAVCSDIKKTNS